MPVGIAYIAGPYRAGTINGVRENVRRAEDAAARLLSLGIYPICPHLNTAFFDGIVDDEVFLEGALRLLRDCADALVLIGEWQNSVGALAEVAEAKLKGIPIVKLRDLRKLLP